MRRLDVKGRRLSVLTTVGNRSTEHILAGARILTGHFDHYVCSRDKYYSEQTDDSIRGCPADETPTRLRDALIANGVDPHQITLEPDSKDAVRAGLNMAQEGDLVLTLGTEVDSCWDQITHHKDGSFVSGHQQRPISGT